MAAVRDRVVLTRILCAVACVVYGAAFGLAFGLWDAWHSVAEQGYDALGFTRSSYLVYREHAVAGSCRGALLGACAGSALLAASVAMIAFPRIRVTEQTIGAVLRSGAGLAWSSAAMAAMSTTALFLVARDKHSLAFLDLAYTLGFTVACGLALAAISLAARRSGSLPVHAFVACLATAAIPAFWINRSILSTPLDRGPWTANALVVLLAIAVFGWTRKPRPHRAIAVALALVLLLAAGIAAAMERWLGEPSLRAEKPWNVLLIGIDSLRADATSLYGSSLHGRDTTPNLRKLAQRGVSFENAVAQAPWTMPSFASMLTGKYPHEHGAYSLSGTLRPGEVTLAEVLREAGYATRAIVSNSYVGTHRSFDQGFERFDESNTLDNRAVTSKAITDLSIRAFEEAGGRPMFLFAHYMDPHYEYMDHAELPWAEGYRGWLRQELDSFDNLLKIPHLLAQEDVDWLVDLYEEEVAQLDREIGRLIDWIDGSGLAESTLIVVVSDHGDEFLDHRSFGHTATLFEEQLRVPLIVVEPGGPAGVRSNEVVEARAIFGTVLDALQIDFDAGSRARSLRADLADGATPRPAFSVLWLPEAHREGGRRFRLSSLRDGRWKLIRDYTRDSVQLFDLEADPRELDDVADHEPEIRDRMRAALDAWTRDQQDLGEAPTVSIDPDLAQQLKDLGYL